MNVSRKSPGSIRHARSRRNMPVPPRMEDTSTGEVYHLLWSSDRLEIAREVDSRITQIYADLVSLEKMMHYKRSIIDVLKDVLPDLNMDEGRRLTLVEECHDRWVENARSLRSGRKEERP